MMMKMMSTSGMREDDDDDDVDVNVNVGNEG